jgi:PAS domain S-box-containing protein
MQTFHKRFSVVAVFVLLGIVLAANTLVIRRQLAVQIDNQAWTAHSRQVLFELSQTESILKDAETGQRGFLYTGDLKYLAPYDLAVSQVESHITHLAQLTADNPDQQAHIVLLRGQVQEKVDELAKTIALYRSGKAEEAKALVLSDVGLLKMNDIRQLIDQMGQEESSLETTRLASYQKRVTFLNPLAEQLTGRSLEHAKGRAIQEVFPIFNESTHKVVENPVEKVMELGRVVGLANHTVLQNSDGTLIPIEDSAAPIRDAEHKLIGVVLVFRDATHERKAQEVLRRTEKLAAAARLAATVAHEINNPLEAIGNLIYIAKGIPGLPAAAAEQLALADQELERVSHITRQTLGFYRESKMPDQIEIPALVESVLKIYSNKFRTKNITIEREVGECPPILGLSGELKQVVANLISNAADAVSENGTIWVRLSCVENHNSKAVQVSIEDDGPGITEEHRNQIFEPFFTTKKDVGTGLGLWVTKEIVDRHNGSIEVRSRNDGSSGTVFNVLLPLAPDVRSRPVSH